MLNKMNHDQAGKRQKPGRKRKTSPVVRFLGCLLLAVLVLMILALIAFRTLQPTEIKGPGPSTTAVPDPSIRGRIMNLADSTEFMQQARKLKADYRELFDALLIRDLTRASQLQAVVEEDIQALDRSLSHPVMKAAGITPFLRDEVNATRELLAIAEEGKLRLIDPLLELRENTPLSSLKTEDGFRVDLVYRYLDFAEEAFPVAEDLSARLNGLDRDFLKLADSDGKILQYADTLSRFLEAAEPYKEFFPFVRAFLGNGGDRLYLFAAQNTAEIRASGGFPGSIGIISIKDGLLSVQDFKSVYRVFAAGTPSSVTITPTEVELFKNRMRLPWDSDFCPDFERVAEIWAAAYESWNGRPVDGVISATPIIVQRLLSFLGEITLSDGTVLNGENAMRVLGHDLYFKYLSARPEVPVLNAEDAVDLLFAEAAKKMSELLFSTVTIKHLADYQAFLTDSIADRSLMLWMSREEEQETVRRLGWAGTLNQDETKPQLGVFFNTTDASKVAWFLDVDVSIGDGTPGGSGTTYPVTVRFTNRITPEEASVGGVYIFGHGSGKLMGSLYLFAPAGGSIANCSSDSGSLRSSEYRGLSLVTQDIVLLPEKSVVIECEVTTSAAAEAPLSVMQMPTAQGYRD